MRALKVAVIVMSVLIVVGTATLVVVVVRRSAGAGASRSGIAANLNQPAGSRIVGIAAVQDRLAIGLQGGGEDRVLLLDTRNGAVVGRITLTR